MKKILVLGINYTPEMTGIGKYTGEFCDFMAASGYDVQMVTGHPYYPFWKNIGNQNTNWYSLEYISDVRVWRCPMFIPNPKKTIHRILQDLSFFCSSFIAVSLMLFKRNKADVFIVISPSVLNGLIGLWYKFWHPSVKFIYHVQDLQIDAAGELGMIKNKRLLSFLKKLELRIITNADIISTISEGMLRKIRAKSNKIKQTVLFPNWSNQDKIFPCTPGKDFYDQYSLPLNKRIILYSGSIGEKQGLDMILEAAAALSNQKNDIHFVISGTGPYFNVLKEKGMELGHDNIQFLPLLDIEDYNRLLSTAWLHLIIQKEIAADLLLPSKLTSIVAAGGAAIVTAASGTSLYSLIHDHQIGWSIEPDNAQALTDVILDLSEKELAIQEVRTNALNYSRNYIHKDVVINKFLSNVHALDEKMGQLAVPQTN